jgi:hypothetical protein
MSTLGIAGVQMQVSAFVPNLERMNNGVHPHPCQSPWVRMFMSSELLAPNMM